LDKIYLFKSSQNWQARIHLKKMIKHFSGITQKSVSSVL